LCPGCEAETSTIRAAFERDESCPSCGLSAEAAAQVLEVRARRGDERLRADLEAALKRADAAEQEVAVLRNQVRGVRAALDGGGHRG
jgi:hypothetical protein